MGRLLLGLAAAALLFLGGGALVRALASDETRIRWLVADMAEGFDDERTSACLEGFDARWRDETSGVDREELRLGLVRLFFEERDPKTKRFRFRLEVPEDQLAVAVEPDGRTARVRGVLRLIERRGEGDAASWEARFDARAEEGEDGWRFVRSFHATETGSRPGRRAPR